MIQQLVTVESFKSYRNIDAALYHPCANVQFEISIQFMCRYNYVTLA